VSPDSLSLNGEHEDESLPEEARRKIKQYIDVQGISQAAAARMLNMGQSTLSQFLSGTYEGDSTQKARDIMQFLRREHERKERPEIGQTDVVETSVYQRVHQVAKMAHHERDVGVIIGDAGLGKTRALEAYEEEHPAATVRIEVGPEFSSRSLGVALHQELGGEGQGSLYTLMQDLYEQLEGTDRLIIIDQAELLPTRGLELCRRLHDVCNLGVVLAGMPRLLANLQGSTGELKQLYSRVGLKARVDELTDDDLRMLVAAHTPDAAPGTSQAVAEVTRNTRVATKLLKRAAHIADVNDLDQVGEAAIDRATQMLVIPDPADRS
jgi:DNA transposition AAA+ family ATPase